MTCLRDLDSTKYLKHIEKIYSDSSGYDKDHGEKKLHVAAYYDFCAILTHFVLWYSTHATLTLDGKTGDSISFLPNFHCLAHLDFINYYYDIDDLTIYSIQAI
jgi:hypothetical protein